MASRIRVQEFLGTNGKVVRGMVGNEKDPAFARLNQHWHKQGHIAEMLILTANEFMRANKHDRTVDLTAASHVAENFFQELEKATQGSVCPTARDKELFLMYCHVLTLWFYGERSSAAGGTALRDAQGRVVQWVCTEGMAVAMLSLMDMTYYYHMDSKIAVAFAHEAASCCAGAPSAKRRRTAKITQFTDHVDYLHATDAYSAPDERYAVIPNCSMQELAHRLKNRLAASVEQIADALKRIRTLTMPSEGKKVPVMKVESPMRGVPSVAFLIAFLKKGAREVARPHAAMKEVLQRVLSYPSQKPRRYVTMWTLEGTVPEARLAGAHLLETMEVGPGEREFRIYQAASTASKRNPIDVLGTRWTIDEKCAYDYAKRYSLPYAAPPEPAHGHAPYPHDAMQRQIQYKRASRGTGAMLRASGFVVDAPADFPAAANNNAMAIS